jgi:hypothetical protein
MNPKNWIGGKLVDFQAWVFHDRDAYVEGLIERAHKYAAWGSRSEPYQSLLGVKGQRDQNRRAQAMGLDEIDFTGKTVLDLGCNLGLFCQDALQRGAQRATGVDLPHVAEVAYELANWNCAWNADFLGLHLPRESLPQDSWDIVYALSVDRQIGYSKWMADLSSELFFLEGHVPDQEVTYRERLEEHFSKVEFLGMTRDHGPRPLFRCWK